MADIETTKLVCKCGNSIEGQVPGEFSWERMANLAQNKGWFPVVVGVAVGMSAGTHHYACSVEHQQEWLADLR